MVDHQMIEKMARAYLSSKDATMRSVAKEFGIGYGTLQKCFSSDLKEISPKLYEKVSKKKTANIEKTRHNFDTSKKVCILQKIKSIFHKEQ